jgi:hypothetical protein
MFQDTLQRANGVQMVKCFAPAIDEEAQFRLSFDCKKCQEALVTSTLA